MSKKTLQRLAALILGSVLALAALPILAVGYTAIKEAIS
jgi:hypothetical protein